MAEGTYRPDDDNAHHPNGTDLRTDSFKLIDGVCIYGGFTGNETSLDERAGRFNKTILSGDLQGNDNPGTPVEDMHDDPSRADNCYHVVTGSGTDDTAVLDGFTIIAGNANSRDLPNNCGGGMRNWPGSPRVRNCTFSGNSANFGGGGMSNENESNPILHNCIFTRNWTGRHGGGLANGHSNPILTNCTFRNNKAVTQGGGINNWEGKAKVINCILWGNTAPKGPQIYNDWAGSAVVTYSDIQGGWPGEGNISDDPCFVTGPLGDFYLSQVAAGQSVDSPCVNTGSDLACMFGLDQFTTRTDHVCDTGIVDMGYHYYAPPTNTAPVANAGNDQTACAWMDDVAEVSLDGSDSNDVDGDELTYLWTWTIDSNEVTATGVNPTIELPVGVHEIQLVVNDGMEDSEPNEVFITIIEPMEANVHIVPRVINRNNHLKRIIAIVCLPEGISKDDVVHESFELYAGGLDGEPIGAILERVIGRGNITRVFVLFDKDEVMNAVEDVVGSVELTVVGKLKSGQYIQGSDTVRIVKPRRLRPHWQAGRRRR